MHFHKKLQQLRDRGKKRVRFSCGTQTSPDCVPEVMAFPRGTQTIPIVHNEVSTSIENLVTSAEANTQTDPEVSVRNVSSERETTPLPFGSLFGAPSASRVGQSKTLLFPSAMSPILLSGAGNHGFRGPLDGQNPIQSVFLFSYHS